MCEREPGEAYDVGLFPALFMSRYQIDDPRIMDLISVTLASRARQVVRHQVNRLPL